MKRDVQLGSENKYIMFLGVPPFIRIHTKVNLKSIIKKYYLFCFFPLFSIEKEC